MSDEGNLHLLSKLCFKGANKQIFWGTCKESWCVSSNMEARLEAATKAAESLVTRAATEAAATQAATERARKSSYKSSRRRQLTLRPVASSRAHVSRAVRSPKSRAAVTTASVLMDTLAWFSVSLQCRPCAKLDNKLVLRKTICSVAHS